ncbi:MAG: glycoside hydrolase, family 43 [Actinomycetia bacterium]|nr:glycoside hydrolase, family 43 [Actinomycetes bacterium]
MSRVLEHCRVCDSTYRADADRQHCPECGRAHVDMGTTAHRVSQQVAGARARRTRRRRIRSLVVLGSVLLVGFGVALGLDLQVRADVRRTNAEIRDVRSGRQDASHAFASTAAGVEGARLTIATVIADTQAVMAQRDATHMTLDETTHQLTSTQSVLTQNSLSAFYQGTQLGLLTNCLAGLQKTYVGIAQNNDNAAFAALQGVSGSCNASARSTSSAGEVFAFDFADPFVLRVGNVFYGYSTNSGGGDIQVVSSTDLHQWTWLPNALAHLPAWAQPDRTWAPAVLPRPGGYVAYYTVRNAASGQQCVSRAFSTRPDGPFTDTSTGPLVCQSTSGGTIDPSPFVDKDGRPYLLFKSDGVPARIWSQPLTPDGLNTLGVPTQLIKADQVWEKGVVEGPSMVIHNGKYYLFYSGNDWKTRNYAIGYAVCASITGPCTKSPYPALATTGTLAGPGGQEFFTTADGALQMAFHAYTDPDIGYPNSRTLHTLAVAWNGDFPVLNPTG